VEAAAPNSRNEKKEEAGKLYQISTAGLLNFLLKFSIVSYAFISPF